MCIRDRVVGEGTEKLAQLKQRDTFQLTGPMGNGFDVPDIVSKYKKIAVVGGGIGTAPMFQLTRELAAAGVKPDVFFGFRDTPYCMEEYRSIANLVKVSTDTGAVGFHGFVTQLYDPADYDVVLVCGPTVMMKNAARPVSYTHLAQLFERTGSAQAFQGHQPRHAGSAGRGAAGHGAARWEAAPAPDGAAYHLERCRGAPLRERAGAPLSLIHI